MRSDWHRGNGDATGWHWKQRLWSRFPGREEMAKEERDLACEEVEPPDTAEAQVRLRSRFGECWHLWGEGTGCQFRCAQVHTLPGFTCCLLRALLALGLLSHPGFNSQNLPGPPGLETNTRCISWKLGWALFSLKWVLQITGIGVPGYLL